MIIAHFIIFLRQNFRTGTSGTFARSLSTYMHIHMQAAYGDAYCAKTQTYTYMHTCRGYISHRRSSLYVNCIRNSEYPTNFLHTDHSRISAKRTSIRRSLHHKFRRTWRNAHLVEAPALHLGCTKRAHCFPQCCDYAPHRFTRFPCFRLTQNDCSDYLSGEFTN